MFPAPAGINRSSLLRQTTTAGVPRASGDKPTANQPQK
ncbi:hypothetical protein ECDEC5A_3312 [Escherichia coli DEC5A]|nr:hypothetical protein ECDEC5A_3312 [Escherichia coli DEC5A]